jgi:hypothetical protein
LKTIAFDTETYPFYKTGKATKDIVPRMVCMSWCDGETTELLERDRALPLFRSWLEDLEGVCFVGLNLAFDMAVMTRAMEEEYPEAADDLWQRIYAAKKWDIGVESMLLDISLGGMFLRGRYSLAALTNRWLGEEMEGKKREGLGPDVWRNRYNELEGRRAEEYPAAAYAYALRDADVTWRIFATLQKSRNPNRAAVPIRSQYAFDLHLMSAWGLLVDGPWVRAIKAHYEKELAHYRQLLETIPVEMPDGPQTVLQSGTKKRAVIQEVVRRAWESVGERPMLTDKGGIKADSKVMKDLESRGVTEPLFQFYSRFNRAEKFLATYVEPLMDAEDGPICPRYSVTVDSGRTSASGPNIQNFPSRQNKTDKASLKSWDELQHGEDGSEDDGDDMERLLAGFVTGPDLRGAFIPRPGCVFVAADYSAIEMAGLAQACRNITGETGTLALAINEKLDLHLYVAAKLLGISYKECEERFLAKDKEIADWRQVSKIANYGFAGGASAKTFIDYAAGYDMKIDLHTAEKTKAAWLAAWSEVGPYFRFIAGCETASGTFHVEQHGPDRMTQGWRLRVTNRYTAAANTLFQGIVADGALYAVHLIVKACYTEKDSPLYGCRPLLFVHDEVVIEAPAEGAEAAAAELSRLMVLGMKKFLPDLLVEAKPQILTDRWSK